MSAKDARDLRQSISDAEHTLGKHRQIQHQNTDRVEELQMQHNRSGLMYICIEKNDPALCVCVCVCVHVCVCVCVCRSVRLIDAACRKANDKLHRLSALLPDAASLPPLEYDTSRRADPEVLQRLVTQARDLRVSRRGGGCWIRERGCHDWMCFPLIYL